MPYSIAKCDETHVGAVRTLLQRLHIGDHAFAHGRVRQTSEPSRHVVHHVVRLRGGWNYARGGRVRQRKLEKKLPPSRAVKLARPVGQRYPLYVMEQSTALERAVDKRGNPPILSQW